YVRELSRLAQDLGSRLIRVFTGFEHTAASYHQQWRWCVDSLKECARYAAPHGVTIGVQNHHDIGAHWESLLDLFDEVGEPNCQASFDAWAPALHGSDLAVAARQLAPRMVHTTVADYVRRPRFRYLPPLINYAREAEDMVGAVPMGEGFINYRPFLEALAQAG